jgi:hypothetical protein
MDRVLALSLVEIVSKIGAARNNKDVFDFKRADSLRTG